MTQQFVTVHHAPFHIVRRAMMAVMMMTLAVLGVGAQTKSYTRIAEFEAERTNSKVYVLKATRSPLYYNTTNNELAGYWTSQSQDLQGSQADATSTEQQFAFLRTDSTEAGKYYMWSVVGEKFITALGKGTDTPEAIVSLVDVTDKDDNSHQGMKLYIGTTGDNVVNVTYWNNNTSGGVRYNTNTENDAGNVFELIAYDQDIDLSAAIAEIKDLEAVWATADEIAAAQAQMVVGVGYPKTTSTEYQTLASLTPTSLISKTDLDAALAAYLSSADVLLPVDGKAYILVNTMGNAERTKRYMKYVKGQKVSVSTNEAEASVFVCKELREGVYAFVTEDGNILTWIGNDETDAYKEDGNIYGYSSNYATAYGGKTDWNEITVKKVAGDETFGQLRMVGRRKSSSVSSIIVHSGENRFDQAADSYFFNDDFSSVWSFTEVAHTNTLEQTATLGEIEMAWAIPTITANRWVVSMTIATGCTVHYTTDGTEPTAVSTQYTSPFSHDGFAGGTTVKAIAVKDGVASSVVSYKLDKAAAPTGTFSGDNTTVTLTAPANSTVYYTTDGTEPTVASDSITAGNSSTALSTDLVIKAVTRTDGKLKSDVATLADKGDEPVISSTDNGTYLYRIVNARYYAQKDEKRIITPVNVSGTYGSLLQVKVNDGQAMAASNQFWYFIDTDDGDDSFYIVHGASGQYLYRHEAVDDSKDMELSSTHRSKYVLEPYKYKAGNTVYNSYRILHKDPNQGVIAWGLNPHGGNGDGKYIGTYNKTDDGSNWLFADEVSLPGFVEAPTITVSGWKAEMNAAQGASIYYTTDGTLPTTASELYSDDFDHSGASALQAIAVKDGVSSPLASFTTRTAAPKFTFTNNYGQVTFTTGADTTYYYTEDGTAPGPLSATIAVSSSKEFNTESKTIQIKVVALQEGKLASDVVTIEHRTLGVEPEVSGDTETKVYRIVNTRRYTDDNVESRYLYPLNEKGTYGRWLKMTTTGNTGDDSEQYWYLVDAGDGYRYIVNRNTGEYLYYNTTAVNGQKRFELSASHRTKFRLSPSLYTKGNGIIYHSYNILPADDESVSFNPHGGPDGYIASYGKGDGGSHWFFTDEATVTRCATPGISVSGKEIVLTNNNGGGTIYYTADGTLPTSSSEPYTAAISHENYVPCILVARTLNDGAWPSAVASKKLERSATPTFNYSTDYQKLIVSCHVPDTKFYYTTDGSEPTYDYATEVSTGAVEIPVAMGTTVKVFALTDGYLKSEVAEYTMETFTAITTAEQLKAVATTGRYYLAADIALTDGTSIAGFSGVLDGRYYTISGLTAPLFSSTDGATIKNVVLSGVNITGGTGNVGAIVGTAMGATRIYNCGVLSGEVGGGTNVGSIAGKLEGSARVVNCYSFADITGGTTVAGIVGYNGVASTASNLQTLVVNCMYYGDITGTNVYPIYGGEKISNSGANGINNYNYYRHEAQITPTAYNCALAAEDKYLTRFEFYRHVLNSQRRLCAYYVAGSVAGTEHIAKWVLDTEVAQYPILKPWGEYASPINRTPVNVLGTLTVNIQGVGAEGGALAGKALSLPITDVDSTTHDYNYYKVQLPYYNDHYTDNYTNNKVVTGWKITAITGGTAGELTTTGDNRYNFADRNCTQKDLYSESDRVLAQGGFFNVPEGVTAITIEPYWGKAVYLSDRYYDVRYSGATGHGLTQLGETPVTYNGQTVYKTLGDVWEQLDWDTTPFDNAIVLAGNYHSYDEAWHNGGNKQFTIMSVDDNRDDEPDYSLYFKTSVRVPVNPVRFDFINHVNLGMAAKEDGRQDMAGVAIFKPKGWFEVTETALALYTEFEYDINDSQKDEAPLILNGGIYEQFCSALYGSHANKTLYTIVGGNCYFKAYTPGCQNGASAKTNFPPVSILGGEYEEFYLSGVKADVTPVENYNALCYGNGGKIGVFAGACQEQINGDVIVKVDHLMVDEFYGGGINDKKPILGNINITIDNSQVGVYCGGPKFGNMAEGKTVTTQATGTTFGQFYGAGYGGTSLYRHKHNDSNEQTTYNTAWFNTYSSNRGKYYNTDGSDRGIMVDYEMEHFCYAGGGSVNARFYTNYASLSVAEVRNVNTTLTHCTINGDLYGGGCQGKATGTLVTTLTNCTVNGSAFAGGYSAAVPTCAVMPVAPPDPFPTYNTNTGVFTPPEYPAPVAYTWAKANAALVHDGVYISDDEKREIYTEVDLTDLGTVYGATRMIVNGNTHIAGSVFGGGNMSKVKNGQTEIIIDGAGVVIDDSVFGGGNEAQVVGNTHVHIKNGTVNGNVYGAGNKAEVTGTTDVVIGGGD